MKNLKKIELEEFKQAGTSSERFYLKLCILEIRAQSIYADIAYKNIHPKSATYNNWVVFSSLHSFLSHCAIISKLLSSKTLSHDVAYYLEVSKKSLIHNRKFRNTIEHYDEKLKDWVLFTEKGSQVFNHFVGKKIDLTPNKDSLFIHHYDPQNETYTLFGENLRIDSLHNEALKICHISEKWLNRNGFEAISPWQQN